MNSINGSGVRYVPRLPNQKGWYMYMYMYIHIVQSKEICDRAEYKADVQMYLLLLKIGILTGF